MKVIRKIKNIVIWWTAHFPPPPPIPRHCPSTHLGPAWWNSCFFPWTVLYGIVCGIWVIKTCVQGGSLEDWRRKSIKRKLHSHYWLLSQYDKDGGKFLNHTVTGDETWSNNKTPVSGMTTFLFSIKMEKRNTLSTRKVMATVLWDRKEVPLITCLERRP